MSRALHQSRHAEALSEALNNTLHAYNIGQHRYMEEFIHLHKSASDLLQMEVFPDAKEITESFAAFNAVKTKIRPDLSDPTITLVSVGDGRTPRTAAMFAYYTKWNCVSIDPQLNTKKFDFWREHCQRLEMLPQRVQDLNLKFDKVIIVAVHSHAPLQSILEHVKGTQRSLVAIPCCVSYDGYKVPPHAY